MEHPPTPRLSEHARQRCREMGVTTHRVKRILRDPDLSYASGRGKVAWRRDDPAIAVVYVMDGATPFALTVVPRTQERYERATTDEGNTT